MSSVLINPHFVGALCEQQPAIDLLYSNVSSLLHFNGVDGSSTFTDEKGKVWTRLTSSSQIDTAQSKFGGASLLVGGGQDAITTPDHADFALGSGAFTIEAWVRHTVASPGTICSQEFDNTSNLSIRFLVQSNGSLRFMASSDGTTFALDFSGGTSSLDTWMHAAVTRNGNDFRLFMDGVIVATLTQSITIANSNQVFMIGANGLSPTGNSFDGHIDEFRLTKGVARYTSNFLIQCNEFAGI